MARRNDDLAYGDIPQRWDRERFERFGRNGPTSFEDDYRYTERDRPGRRDIAVAERREASRPGSRWEERDRYFEEDRIQRGPRKRTDRELFGDVDPREIAEMALTPYRRKSITREELDFERGPRPGLMRRQSSLDTFDRRPARYEQDEYRMAPYQPVPLPIRRRRDVWADDDDIEDYREVEIKRERSVRRRRAPRSEKSVKEEVKSVHHHKSSSSSSSSSSFEEEEEEIKSVRKAPSTKAPSTKAPSTKARSSKAPSVYESFHERIEEEIPAPVPMPPPSVRGSLAFEESIREERRFKKGKTRMPKRLVRKEAVMDLGYPFDEEEDFLVLRIALEKEQIDEVIKISEHYKENAPEKRTIYHFDEKEEIEIPAPPVGEREEIQRTEWINPPTVVGSRSRRSRSVHERSPHARSSVSQRSPARTSRTRHPSPPAAIVEERRTVIEESRSPHPPTPPVAPEYYEDHRTIIEERAPSHHTGTVVLAGREHRSDHDINAEIRALELERRALRVERGAEERRDLAHRVRRRSHDELELVDFRDRSRPREELVLYEREHSPVRNVVRVEKDRKERQKARLLGMAMATLT